MLTIEIFLKDNQTLWRKAHLVEPDGDVQLGPLAAPLAGRFSVAGLSIVNAERHLRNHLVKKFSDPKVQIEHIGSAKIPRQKERLLEKPFRLHLGDLISVGLLEFKNGQPQGAMISPRIATNGSKEAASKHGSMYTIGENGVALGAAIGRVQVIGMTLSEAEAAIQKLVEQSHPNLRATVWFEVPPSVTEPSSFESPKAAALGAEEAGCRAC